ncbi:dihydrolipoamide acetyltransferase family protein [Rhodobacter sp. 24-YEA-8]|uniref:dihydrolipoamide acetyltransferase family protein n=1 Tax=Rhodobacter sp. 24-YEA-8 TaxID=1884310 RepID=UPI00089A517E|nr:dihydrolipoamide acetyltransferase family protein [Rhodobacter sp. 24-YEA-8]SED64768.1 branched-chain alpha-keto acid dehydrogenase E2 component [Rhodobacter sp. 24-YEA-8]
MGIHSIRVPDIGEGIAETEIAEWLVSPGDLVAEDQPVAAVMTDKATVEIPSPVAGRVIALAAETGTILAVGAELIRLEVDGPGSAPLPADLLSSDPLAPETVAPVADTSATVASVVQASDPVKPVAIPAKAAQPATGAVLAAPSVRAFARERGIDLRLLTGSGPEGRILREDIERFDPFASRHGPRPDLSVTESRVIGLRRRISQRMEEANRIPHITIIEEIDVSALETLRQSLNTRAKNRPGVAKLTLLPFLIRALVIAVADQPVMNAHHLADEGILRRFGGLHAGIATQTEAGLVVPVLRHAETLDLTGIASEIARLAEAARDGRASREELSGSSITISSLGALGAIATTPILNAPEVAIIGVNRMAIRPFWNGSGFEPRRMMNISCSFDHRIIDGHDAALFVQHLKELLETPALLFLEAMR